MEALAWALIVLGDATIAACAVHLTRRHRRGAPHLTRSLHRTVPALLVAGLFPLASLLAVDATAAAWLLWGATTIAAALVYAVGDTFCGVPFRLSRSRPRTGA
ncbi:hypothetical protein ACWC2K_33725 [Streptomyces chattanoogensis]|uniref:hypothetical protein n=1 Tax=Streptomyces chattanoogensis TaxID=66876 RepID=UPI0036869948